MRVKTLKRHRYNQQIHMQGDEYDIPQGKHMRILEAVGRIRRIPETIPAPLKEEPEKPVVKPKAAKKKSAKKSTTKKTSKRKYKRKDMVAE